MPVAEMEEMSVIKMSSKDVKQLIRAWGGDAFDIVETTVDYENGYKDPAPAKWIFKRLSDGSHWRATGIVNLGHYSDNPAVYDADLRRVALFDRATIVQTWELV